MMTITFSKVEKADGDDYTFSLLIGDNLKAYTFGSKSGATRGRAKMFRAMKADGLRVIF